MAPRVVIFFLLCILCQVSHLSSKSKEVNVYSHLSPLQRVSTLTGLATSIHLCRSLQHLKHLPHTGERYRCRLVLLFLFMIAGDIELNPGPSQYPCGYCENPVNWSSRGVCCDNCSVWHHASCMGIGSRDYSHLNGSKPP